MEDDFYASDAYQRAPDLVTMGRMAADDFRRGHPQISEAAVQALVCAYTYDYK